LRYVLLFHSDGGFLSHSKDAYPQPIPTKLVNFNPSKDNQIKDVPNHTEPECDLPAYNDYMVSTLCVCISNIQTTNQVVNSKL